MDMFLRTTYRYNERPSYGDLQSRYLCVELGIMDVPVLEGYYVNLYIEPTGNFTDANFEEIMIHGWKAYLS